VILKSNAPILDLRCTWPKSLINVYPIYFRRLSGPRVIIFAFCLNDYYLWFVHHCISGIPNTVKLQKIAHLWWRSTFWITEELFSKMTLFENVSFRVTPWQVRWLNLKFLKGRLPTSTFENVLQVVHSKFSSDNYRSSKFGWSRTLTGITWRSSRLTQVSKVPLRHSRRFTVIKVLWQ